MQLTFDADVEAFRAEFVAFLDGHLPDEAYTVQRSQSSSDVPPWARQWQRLLFDHGWLLPGNPPEFGGRDATVLKLLGSEAVQAATEHVLGASRVDGLVHPTVAGPYAPLNLDSHYGSWFGRYLRSFAATIAGGTSEIQRNIIAERVLGLPRN